MASKSERELLREIWTLRESVRGLTFSEAPERFKDIEAAKVRLNVLRDPGYYRQQVTA
jgi:hypothetical protein